MKRNSEPKHESTHIGFKAVQGLDNDLIEMWNNLPEGQGSDYLRAALRSYRGQSPDELVAEVRRLAQQVANLGNQVNSLSKQIATGVRVSSNGAADAHGELNDDQVQAVESKMRKAKW